eukprot:gene7095-12740_t
MLQYSTVHVQPVGNDEQDCSFFCQNGTLDNQEIKETHFCYNERNNVKSDSHIPLSIGDSLDMKATPEFELAQEPMYTEDVKDSRSFSRQKMCNLVRNMQQNHIAELFPIIESRETTEGSEEQVICRICHTGGEEILISPCKCIGSAQFVHATCLLTWFKKSVKNQCELCQHQVPIRKKAKPVSKWKKPEDKPIPVIWFTVFFVGLFLNILSIYVNASDSCNSTACLIFYVVNGFGIVLDAAFLWFWWMKCMLYWKKWCAINQDWSITGTTKSYIPVLNPQRRNKSQEVLNPVAEMLESDPGNNPVVSV